MAISYGVDLINTALVNTGYTGFFDSPLYTVGTNKQPRKFVEAEFQLARPLRTNEGVRLAYRTNLTDSFTTLVTIDFATWGAEVSHNSNFTRGTTNIDIKATEQLQIRTYLTGVATSPELKTITLR